MRILLTPEERKARAKASHKRYRKTPKGRATYAASRKRFRNTPEGRRKQRAAYERRWRGFTVKEITVEKYLVDKIEALGGFCPKFIDAGRRGAPDRLVILLGHPTFFVELKRPVVGRVAPWQKRYHERLKACGQKVWVLSCIEEVDDFLITL